MDAATQLERESWLDAARDVIGVADVTEARGVVREAYSYLYDAWSGVEEGTTRFGLDSGQRYVTPDRPDSANNLLTIPSINPLTSDVPLFTLKSIT